MGRLIILMLFAIQVNAQVSSLSIRGVEYEFVGDSFEWFRNAGDYSDITSDDPTTYVNTFVRDAILAGQDLNLAVNNPAPRIIVYSYAISTPINSIILVPRRFYNSVRIGGSSWTGPDTPGFVVTINNSFWRNYTDRERLRLIYHEFGHALLRYGHVCEKSLTWEATSAVSWQGRSSYAIMSTDACRTNFMYKGELRAGPGYTDLSITCPSDGALGSSCVETEGYDFNILDDLLTHFYETTIPVGEIGPVRTSKSGIYVIHD